MKILRPDQVADMSFYMRTPIALNLAEPGTGKTGSVCVNQYARDTQTVWVMPKQLMKKNAEEILAFTPLDAKDIALVRGTKREMDNAMRSDAKVLLMGPDRFKLVQANIPAQYRALDVDEMHLSFGGATSARTEAFYEFMRRVDQAVFMTGTMINGRLDTAFPAINAINPLFYPMGLDSFLHDHAYLDGFGRPYHWHSHEKIRKILGKYAIYRTFASIFGHQEIVMQVEWLEMNERQRAAYAKFEAEAFLELEDFIISGADNPGTATIRARQIMEHPNQFPNLMDRSLPNVDISPGERPSKLDALQVHFDDHERLGTPVIVYSTLVAQQHEIFELARSMGRRTEFMGGETSTANRDRIDKDFVAGKIDVLVASPKVCAVGYNWQFAGDQEVDHIINATIGYWDSDVTQGFRRVVRQKRRKPLRVTTLAYMNSLDPAIMAINERKSRDATLAEPTRELLRFDGVD